MHFLLINSRNIQGNYGKKAAATTTTDISFDRLHTLEFTSDRKRMSTIIRDLFGQIWLYTKGAESHVLPLCKSTPEQHSLKNITQTHIDDFANMGLRTLAVARRRLTPEEYSNFNIGRTSLCLDKLFQFGNINFLFIF